jgi:transcriptional regulator with XRE-family HTH domain
LHYRWHKVGAVDTIGGRIRTTRKALGLNQTELAKLVGLDQSTISDIENGALFGADVLMALAAALLKSPQFIMTGAAPICTTAALRSPAIRAEFQRLNPCPANGNKRGACPGWEREHTTPLCAGGADAVENMTWMRVEHHKAKTKQDMAACRAYRRAMTMGAAAP